MIGYTHFSAGLTARLDVVLVVENGQRSGQPEHRRSISRSGR
jgi:hypothetical protein